jgi:hypothetical protein
MLSPPPKKRKSVAAAPLIAYPGHFARARSPAAAS